MNFKWLFVLPLMSAFAVPTFLNAEVLTWDCNFASRVDANGVATEEMELVFKVDTVSKLAIMEGNAGLVDVDLHIGEEAFSFVEKVPNGSAQTTTITRDGLAVHSRNTVILGEFVAAQHFGRCRFQ